MLGFGSGSLVIGDPNFTQSFGPKLKYTGLGIRLLCTLIIAGSHSGALPALLPSSAFRLVIVPMFCPCHVTSFAAPCFSTPAQSPWMGQTSEPFVRFKVRFTNASVPAHITSAVCTFPAYDGIGGAPHGLYPFAPSSYIG